MGSLWKSLKRPARLAIMAVAALTAVVIIWLLADSLIPVPMEVLFHRLDPLQANEVASMLEEEGIPYKITDGGSTILVPRDKRDRLRLTISPNLYAQGAGFALFENDSLVASDFERRVQ
jgi:flagellar M-ring protein FliF